MNQQLLKKEACLARGMETCSCSSPSFRSDYKYVTVNCTKGGVRLWLS
jgi:hypothetical protein